MGLESLVATFAILKEISTEKERGGRFAPPSPSTGLSVAALTELLVILQRSGIASGSISFLPAPDQSLNMQAEF